jgi:hypothetical protein
MIEHIYNRDLQLVETRALDTGTGIVTVTPVDGPVTTAAAAPQVVAALIESTVIDARRLRLDQAAATLRQWAADADATTVTAGNAVAVLGVVVDRLAVFFDRFADLLDERGR